MNEDPRGEPGLYDLPLDSRPPEPTTEAVIQPRPSRRARRTETLPLFSENEVEDHLAERLPAVEERAERSAQSEAAARARPVAVPSPAPGPPTAGLASRLRGGVADMGILAAVGVIAAAGAAWLGAPIGPAQLAPLGSFVLAFSFVYFVVALAFWGSTPGMSWAGLVARTRNAEPLSFGQTALRWLATWLTWGLAGLPGLLALTGRSLADRLSGSRTYAADETATAN